MSMDREEGLNIQRYDTVSHTYMQQIHYMFEGANVCCIAGNKKVDSIFLVFFTVKFL